MSMKRSWIALAAAVLGTSASPAHALTLGLEGYWKFDGDGADSSTHGRPLAVPAGASFAAGLFGQAVVVAGSEANAPARPGDDAAFDFGTGDFTIQVWANFTSTSGEQILLEKFTGGAGPGWTLTKLSNGSLLFFGGPSVASPSALPLSTGVWSQFVARRSGTDLRLFFDGASVASTTLVAGAAIGDTAMPLLLGARDGSQNFPLKGSADEVAIWSRALTDGEITTLYNGGAGTQIPEPSTLALLAMGVLALEGTRAARRARPA